MAELVIALARTRLIALDELARVTGTSTAELLDAVEVEAGHVEAMAWLGLILANRGELAKAEEAPPKGS